MRDPTLRSANFSGKNSLIRVTESFHLKVGRGPESCLKVTCFAFRAMDIPRHSENVMSPDDPAADRTLTSDRLLPVMYEKLRQLAASKMFRESGLQTLQPTALVHEAWLRLADSKPDWDSQAHFFGAAAEAMRRVLVDRSRAKSALKRQLTEDASVSPADEEPERDRILIIHEALKRLEAEDPKAAEIVALKFFSGFTSGEIAAMSRQSVRSVERQWTFAKARLFRIIQDELGELPA